MTLGQAEPALQIEIVVDLVEGVIASKEAGAEALHQPGHLFVDRIAVAAKAGEDRVEVGLTLADFFAADPGSRPPPGSSRRGTGSSPVGV